VEGTFDFVVCSENNEDSEKRKGASIWKRGKRFASDPCLSGDPRSRPRGRVAVLVTLSKAQKRNRSAWGRQYLRGGTLMKEAPKKAKNAQK